MKLQIYKQEKLDGIADKIRAGNSVAYAIQIKNQAKGLDSGKIVDQVYKSVAEKYNQPDLYYLRTILVSVGWNANDDVFGPEPVWAARHTPEDKPFNYEHNFKDIIGHITSSYIVDEDFNLIDDDTAFEEVPSRFHVLTGAVIYKHQDTEEDQKRIDKIIAEIESGEWFVSMEALFSKFDYALKDKSTGEVKIVARNSETAFLSKYLRAYGGSGEYNNNKIGRYLKSLVFSGKGLVRNPANEKSVILLDVEKFNNIPIVAENWEEEEKKKKNVEKEIISNDTVYITKNETVKGEIMNENEKLLNDLKTATAQLADAKAEHVKLSDEINKLKADSILASENIAKLTKELETVAAEKIAVEKEVVALKSEKKVTDRSKLLATKLRISEEAASEMVKLLASLSDDNFSKYLDKQVALSPKTEAKVDATTILDVTLEQAKAGVTMSVTATEKAQYEQAASDLLNIL